MIILSQDKEEIINFNNVNYIGRNENMIYADFKNDNFRIGLYKTEERAKEVMKEIIAACTNFEHFKTTTDKQKEFIEEKLIWEYETFDIYQMPEK